MKGIENNGGSDINQEINTVTHRNEISNIIISQKQGDVRTCVVSNHIKLLWQQILKRFSVIYLITNMKYRLENIYFKNICRDGSNDESVNENFPDLLITEKSENIISSRNMNVTENNGIERKSARLYNNFNARIIRRKSNENCRNHVESNSRVENMTKNNLLLSTPKQHNLLLLLHSNEVDAETNIVLVAEQLKKEIMIYTEKLFFGLNCYRYYEIYEKIKNDVESAKDRHGLTRTKKEKYNEMEAKKKMKLNDNRNDNHTNNNNKNNNNNNNNNNSMSKSNYISYLSSIDIINDKKTSENNNEKDNKTKNKNIVSPMISPLKNMETVILIDDCDNHNRNDENDFFSDLISKSIPNVTMKSSPVIPITLLKLKSPATSPQRRSLESLFYEESINNNNKEEKIIRKLNKEFNDNVSCNINVNHNIINCDNRESNKEFHSIVKQQLSKENSRRIFRDNIDEIPPNIIKSNSGTFSKPLQISSPFKYFPNNIKDFSETVLLQNRFGNVHNVINCNNENNKNINNYNNDNNNHDNNIDYDNNNNDIDMKSRNEIDYNELSNEINTNILTKQNNRKCTTTNKSTVHPIHLYQNSNVILNQNNRQNQTENKTEYKREFSSPKLSPITKECSMIKEEAKNVPYMHSRISSPAKQQQQQQQQQLTSIPIPLSPKSSIQKPPVPKQNFSPTKKQSPKLEEFPLIKQKLGKHHIPDFNEFTRKSSDIGFGSLPRRNSEGDEQRRNGDESNHDNFNYRNKHNFIDKNKNKIKNDISDNNNNSNNNSNSNGKNNNNRELKPNRFIFQKSLSEVILGSNSKNIKNNINSKNAKNVITSKSNDNDDDMNKSINKYQTNISNNNIYNDSNDNNDDDNENNNINNINNNVPKGLDLFSVLRNGIPSKLWSFIPDGVKVKNKNETEIENEFLKEKEIKDTIIEQKNQNKNKFGNNYYKNISPTKNNKNNKNDKNTIIDVNTIIDLNRRIKPSFLCSKEPSFNYDLGFSNDDCHHDRTYFQTENCSYENSCVRVSSDENDQNKIKGRFLTAQEGWFNSTI